MPVNTPGPAHRLSRRGAALVVAATPSGALAQTITLDNAGASFEAGAGFSATGLSTVIVSLGLVVAFAWAAWAVLGITLESLKSGTWGTWIALMALLGGVLFVLTTLVGP